jgi:TolB-like protein/DNA-binding winged helix-turn-helix (wHTH) protein
VIYEFSDLTLDLDRHLLTRDGQPIKLTKLSFKMLQALVHAAPALISHDDLIDQVWGPKRVITPDNLSQRMKTLRQSLGDNVNQPIYIDGVRGEGYRLIPEVKNQSVQASGRSSRQALSSRLLVTLVLLALALVYIAFDRFVPDPVENEQLPQSGRHDNDSAALTESLGDKSIAVMPFTNLSAESSNQFFADGLHDDLLIRISNIQNIKTISRTSVMTYKGSEMKLGAIAKELGVSTILEGGVQRAGDQVRINLQLIDAESDAHIWAQTYTRDLSATNVFVVQAEITEAVAGALQAVLSEDERKQVEKLPTANLQALDAYFVGNEYYNQATSEGYTRAIAAYKKAVDLDPEFALAYSKQAHAVLHQIFYSGFPAEAQLEKSRPLIDQAILLDPQSSEAFTALGRWHRRSGDSDKALQAFERAMALGPNNAEALAGYGSIVQYEMFDPASAIELFERAIKLDPQNIGLKTELAQAMPYVGRLAEGVRMMEGIVAEHPESAIAYRTLANLYSNWEFRHDKGIRVLRRAFELDPNHPPNSYMNAIMYWRLGDYDNTALWMNYIARLVPNPELGRVYRGWAFIAQRNFDSAREEFDRPNSNSSLYWLGVFYLGSVDTAEGRPADAIERFREYAAEFDGGKSNVSSYYGISAIKAYRALGEQEKAQALVDRLLSAMIAGPSLTYHDSAIHDASIYALAGQEKAAITTLEEWVSRGGATSLLQQDIRHGLGVLSDDSRYKSILRIVNNRLSEQKANLARWEASGEMPPIPREVMNPR